MENLITTKNNKRTTLIALGEGSKNHFSTCFKDLFCEQYVAENCRRHTGWYKASRLNLRSFVIIAANIY